MSKDELMEEFMRAEFTSKPSSDGQSLVWFFEGAESFNDRVNEYMTLYRALDDRRIVGISLKPADKLLDALNA